MYKIETQSILTYVNNPDNFTQEEREMFTFLVNTVPETMLYIRTQPKDNPSEEYKENVDFLTLLIVLAKVLGNSKELIKNLKNAHSLPTLIRDILRADYGVQIGEELDWDPQQYAHLKNNNKKLLALKADELGYNIDFNKITKDNNEYLKELDTYFDLMMNHYNTVRNRGSNAALYQLLRDYNRIDESLGFPEIQILEQGERDMVAVDLGLVQGAPNGKPDREFVEPGKLRIIFDTLPEHYGNITYEPNESYYAEGGYFYFNPETELYKLIMSIKPVGIFYELVVKATLYTIITFDKGFRDNHSYVTEDDTKYLESNGFRPLEDIKLTKEMTEITFYDDLTLNPEGKTAVEDIEIRTKVKSNVDINTEWDLEVSTEVGDHTLSQHNIKTNLEKNVEHNDLVIVDDLPLFTTIKNNEEDLQYVTAQLRVSDKYDYTKHKIVEISQEIPEEIYSDKLIVDQDQTQAKINPSDLYSTNIFDITLENNHLRQAVTDFEVEFTQKDFYQKTEATTNIGSIPVVAQETATLTYLNPSSKAHHGTLDTTIILKRDYDENKKLTLFETETIKIKDRYGRPEFEILVEEISLGGDSYFPTSYKLTNPNNFEVKLDITAGWYFANDTKDPDSQEYNQTITLLPLQEKQVMAYLFEPEGQGYHYRRTASRMKKTYFKTTYSIDTPHDMRHTAVSQEGMARYYIEDIHQVLPQNDVAGVIDSNIIIAPDATIDKMEPEIILDSSGYPVVIAHPFKPTININVKRDGTYLPATPYILSDIKFTMGGEAVTNYLVAKGQPIETSVSYKFQDVSGQLLGSTANPVVSIVLDDDEQLPSPPAAPYDPILGSYVWMQSLDDYSSKPLLIQDSGFNMASAVNTNTPYSFYSSSENNERRDIESMTIGQTDLIDIIPTTAPYKLINVVRQDFDWNTAATVQVYYRDNSTSPFIKGNRFTTSSYGSGQKTLITNGQSVDLNSLEVIYVVIHTSDISKDKFPYVIYEGWQV